MTIDPWEPSKFLLTGLALSQSTRPATAAILAATVDLFGDRVPLVFKGAQIIPAGSNRLRKSEKTFLYGEIYEPALSVTGRNGDPGLGLRLTLLDAKTGQIMKRTDLMDLKPEAVPGTSAAPFGLIVPAAELPRGSYVAQIDAQDAASNHSTRTITFELAR